MTTLDFYSILPHLGHHIEIALYGSYNDPTNLSIECTDCNEVLVSLDRDSNTDILWVVESQEKDPEGEILYWSNSMGWVDLESATFFLEGEKNKLHLPMGGTWKRYTEIRPDDTPTGEDPDGTIDLGLPWGDETEGA